MALGEERLVSRGRAADVFLAALDERGWARWSRSLGGPGRQIGRGVDPDRKGNVLFSGEFANTIELDGRTLTSAGDSDLFLAKADSRGRVLWAVQFGGAGREVGPEVEVDAAGSSFLTGSFTGRARFGSKVLTAAGARAAFVAKVSPKGKLVWVRPSGQSAFATLGELALSPGAVNVLGRFVGPTRLGRFDLAPAGRPTSSWPGCRRAESSPLDRGP